MTLTISGDRPGESPSSSDAAPSQKKPPANSKRPTLDIKARKEAILGRIDVRRAFEGMGVQFTASSPNGKGWLECHAVGRDDRDASAGVHLKTGVYNSYGDGAEKLNLFDFALKHGKFADFKEALEHFEGLAGSASSAPPRRIAGKVREPSKVGDAWGSFEGKPTAKPAKPLQKGHDTIESAIASTARSPKVNGEAVKTWTYHWADGSEALRVVRFRTNPGKGKASGKTYRPYHRKEGAGWFAMDPPGPLPLYRLPDLGGEGRVWVFEGEKVADLAANLGLVATTSAHGAQGADASDWLPLSGREVILVPDAGPAGEDYRSKVVEILAKLPKPPAVRVLNLPGLEDGEDLEQWLENAPDSLDDILTRAELEKMAAAIPDPSLPPLPTDEELGLVCLDDVAVEEVTWLWPDRVPRGKITLLAGEGEIGKTFTTLDFIARLTTGRPHPDCPDVPVEPCDCIFVTAEDGIADTIKPRLLRMGGDPRRTFTLATGVDAKGRHSPFTIADIPKLEAVMRKKPGVRLIVIDPISAFLGRVDENKNAELRGLLSPLSEFASNHGVSIIAITHFGKNPTAKASAKILGSVAYSNAARTTWCVFADPNDPDRRLMLRGKNNLSGNKTGLAYRIEDGVVVWEPGLVYQTANDFLAECTPKKAKDREEMVIEAIRLALADGPLTKSEVCARAKQSHNVGKNSVWECKDAAGVVSFKSSFDGGWLWRLEVPNHPEASPTIPKHPQGSRSIPEDDDQSWMDTLPFPKTSPPDFKAEKCIRCGKPIADGDSYHLAWEGDTPVAECKACMVGLGS